MAGSGPGGAEGGLAVPPHPTQEVPKPYTPAAAARHLGILDAALRNKYVNARPREPTHRIHVSWTDCLSLVSTEYNTVWCTKQFLSSTAEPNSSMKLLLLLPSRVADVASACEQPRLPDSHVNTSILWPHRYQGVPLLWTRLAELNHS